jgi:hypothetical protein
MQGVSAVGPALQEVGVDELVEFPRDAAGRERRHRLFRVVRECEEAQEPERPSGRAGQTVVGQMQGDGDTAQLVAVDREGREQAHLLQTIHVLCDRRARTGGDQVGRGDPQREWQVGTALGEPGGRFGFRRHAIRSEDVADQRRRLARGQCAQGHGPCPVAGDQAVESAAAGDHDEAAGAAGQQRPNLVR